MTDSSSNPVTRILPKIIAVGAELTAALAAPAAAAAFLAGEPNAGIFLIGCFAACLGAKNSAQTTTAAESQAGLETLLATLLKEHKTLGKAIEALYTEQHLHELVSRERLSELVQLIRMPIAEVEQKVAENQELTFVIAKYIEEWRTSNDFKLDQIESVLVRLPQIHNAIVEGFGQVQADTALTREHLHRIEAKLDQSLLPMTIDGDPAKQIEVAHLLGPNVSILLQQRVNDASQTLLSWGTTVGAGRHHIASLAEETVITALRGKEPSSNLVLGQKGVGKSALSAAVSAVALREGFAVLAIRADRIPADVNSEDSLRRFLKLPVKVGEALRLLAVKQPTLLVVDQLDSVSELVDRLSERLNLLLNLIHEVSRIPNVHILAACREFDFYHDSRLSTIRANEIRLTPASWESVVPILEAEHHVPALMGEPMRDLLCIPWNLNLFLKVAVLGDVFSSMQSLIEAIWQKWVVDIGGPTTRALLLGNIARKMSDDEQLFVHASIADSMPDARDALLKNEILVAEGSNLSFRHQTYYDYALARLFADGTKSLADHVLSHQDGLFVRPAMLNGLELLRGSSPAAYAAQIEKIFESSPRQHIRTLLIEFIAQQKHPDDLEAQTLLALVQGSDGPLILRAAAGSPGWFSRLRESGDLARWMTRPPEEAALCLNLLLLAFGFAEDAIFELVQRCWFPNTKYDRLLETIAFNLPQWKPAWTTLFTTAVRRSGIGVTYLAGRIVKDNPDIAVQLLRSQLDRELDEVRKVVAASPPTDEDGSDPTFTRLLSRNNNPFNKLIDGDKDNRYGFEEIAKAAPKQFLNAVWPWFVEVLEAAAERPVRKDMYRDDYMTWMGYEMQVIPLLQSLHVAADGWAMSDPEDFSNFAMTEAKSEYLAAHRVLAQALTISAPRVPQAALDFLIGDRRRLAIGTYQNQLRFSLVLIRAVLPHLLPEQRILLESAVLKFDLYPRESFADRDPKTRREFVNWNRENRLRLLAAFSDELLSSGTRELRRQETTRFPSLRHSDNNIVDLSSFGPRMTSDEISKASDANIFKMFDMLAKYGDENHTRRSSLPDSRSGGLRQQAGQVGVFATNHPTRAVEVVNQLDASRTDHQQYAAAVVTGLEKSTLSSTALIELIRTLDDKEFKSDDFRDTAASAILNSPARLRATVIAEPVMIC